MSDDRPGPEQWPRSLQVQLDDDIAQGIYANLVMINHLETEFFLDFILVQPGAPRAKVRSRVVLHPRQAKRLVAALQENVTNYEARFGAIPTMPFKMPGGPPDLQ